MSPHRSERLADTVRELLARALREEVRDPGIGFVTLTGVDLSPDLRHARVHVAAHGSEEGRRSSLASLNRAAPFLRRLLAREGHLRYTPDLHFIEDTGVEHGSRVEEILGEIHRGESGDGASVGPPPPETEDEG